MSLTFEHWLASTKNGVVVERRLRDLWALNGMRWTLEDPDWRSMSIGALIEFAHLQGVMDAFGIQEEGFIPEGRPAPPAETLSKIRALEDAWRQQLANHS